MAYQRDVLKCDILMHWQPVQCLTFPLLGAGWDWLQPLRTRISGH